MNPARTFGSAVISGKIDKSKIHAVSITIRRCTVNTNVHNVTLLSSVCLFLRIPINQTHNISL